jgi:hypothetical protein
MKRAHLWVSLVLAACAAACAFTSCSEPATPCLVGAAGLSGPGSIFGYATIYTVKGALPACADAPGFQPQRGDVIGMQLYYKPNAAGTGFDDTVPASVAIQTQTMGNEQLAYSTMTYSDMMTPIPFTDGVKGHAPYALGSFTTVNPGSDALCHVANLQPAEESFPAVPAGAMSSALPADDLRYDWSNVEVYVTAADQGNQFAGDVTITDQGCAVQYHAVGLWPAIDCSATDAMGNVTGPDLDMCNPCAEPDKGRPTGSGISPDAAVSCVQIFAADDAYGRHPYWCAIAGGEPPQLAKNPPTCMDTTTTSSDGG